jgi:hypothetical protein
MPFAHATTVRLQTTQGAIDINLYDAAAPITVANFLAYIRSGAYTDSLIHRSVPGFVIQGGGYTWVGGNTSVADVPARAPIQNEFSATRSNLRGTIAMAKLGGDPNSLSIWRTTLPSLMVRTVVSPYSGKWQPRAWRWLTPSPRCQL